MYGKAIKTHKIAPGKATLIAVLDRYLKKIPEGSVLAVTSKIVSICEGRVVSPFPKGRGPRAVRDFKIELIKKHTQWYLDPKKNPYNITLTITNNLLVPTAGIDESNSAGYYVLWPRDAQKTANEVREHFVKKFGLRRFGVIITDSRTTPMRYGTTGFSIAHSGFVGLNNYIGKPDIFGRKMKVTKANMMDALGATAVLLMGEGNECTPLALMTDLPFVQFQKRNPTSAELRGLKISMKKDLYAPLLKSAPWKKGRKS